MYMARCALSSHGETGGEGQCQQKREQDLDPVRMILNSSSFGRPAGWAADGIRGASSPDCLVHSFSRSGDQGVAVASGPESHD
jgi:hypothetical protein